MIIAGTIHNYWKNVNSFSLSISKLAIGYEEFYFFIYNVSILNQDIYLRGGNRLVCLILIYIQWCLNHKLITLAGNVYSLFSTPELESWLLLIEGKLIVFIRSLYSWKNHFYKILKTYIYLASFLQSTFRYWCLKFWS